MKNSRSTALVLLGILAIGAFFTWWMLGRAEQELRLDLIRQAQMVAKVIDINRIKEFAGTEADLTRQEYLRTKGQLIALRSTNPQCRFIYLLGRKADDTLFFFVDSEPVGSADYSPPGQDYSEAPDGIRRVFVTGRDGTEGPYTDRWGTWVSAVVPIFDPQTGTLIAALGMDIDARVWRWEVIAKGILPLVAALILVVVSAGIFFVIRFFPSSSQARKTQGEPRRNPDQLAPHGIPLHSYALGFALAWTLIVAGLSWVSADEEGKAALQSAHTEARELYKRYLLLLNPEYMTLKSRNSINASAGVHTHSLGIRLSGQEEPMESRESRLVQEVKKGTGEIDSIETVGGQSVFLYLAPVIMRQECLRCHGSQGYKPGDICSVVSVSVPLAPYLAQSRLNILYVCLKFLALYIFGLIGMGFALRNMGKQIAQNEKMQEALWVSEETYRNQFANNTVVMLLIDPKDGTIIEANAAAVRFYGYPRKQLLSMKITDINTLPAAETQRAIGSITADQGKRFQFQHRLADGSLRDVEVSSSFIQLGNRAILHSIVHDSTDRNKMEQELRESEIRFRRLFDLLPVGVTLTDLSGQITQTNPASEALLGIPSDESLRRNFKGPYWDIVRSDGSLMPTEEYASVRALAEHKLVENVEMGVRKPDGKVAWINVSAEPIEQAGMGVLIIYYDITERRRTEQALQQLTDRLMLAAQAGGVGIWDYDVVHNLLVWDDQMFRLYGITSDQFGGAYEAWQQGVHPEDRQRGDQEIQLALKGEREFNTEFRVLWPDGSTHTIRALAVVQRDHTGHPVRLIGTNWDITAQKQAEQELSRERQRLAGIIEGTHVGTWEWNVQTGETLFNDRWADIIGYTLEEISPVSIGTWMKFAHPEDLRTSGEILDRHFRGELDYYEFLMIWSLWMCRCPRWMAWRPPAAFATLSPRSAIDKYRSLP